jgi:F-type H+-transporting ATPase subunit delta
LRSASLQYANALADVALAQGAAEPLLKELTAFGAIYEGSPELRNFLANPAVNRQAKHGAIEKLVGRLRASKILRNFLFVLADKQRTRLLPEIIAAFQEVIRKRQGITEAEVSSAVELNARQKAELAATLERLTGKRVEAKYSLEPALLGGAVVRIGDTVYDGSLRSRLNELRTRLVAE